MTIRGTVLKVLDSKRLIADIGREAGVDSSMEFVVYSEIEIGSGYGSHEIEKATLSPTEIMDKMTVMETKSEWVPIDFSNLSNFRFGGNVQDEMDVESEVPDDIMVVREGDLIKEVENIEEEEEDPGEEI